MSVTVQWKALEVQPKEDLPDDYIGLLEWVLDECAAAAEEELASKQELAAVEVQNEGSVQNESNAQGDLALYS